MVKPRFPLNTKMAKKRIDAIVVSLQHSDQMTLSQVNEGIREEVIKKIVPSHLIDNKTKIYVNPTGKFVIGGPMGDCGLTEKIIVDTYGGHGAHGGGAFSGMIPKVDQVLLLMFSTPLLSILLLLKKLIEPWSYTRLWCC